MTKSFTTTAFVDNRERKRLETKGEILQRGCISERGSHTRRDRIETKDGYRFDGTVQHKSDKHRVQRGENGSFVRRREAISMLSIGAAFGGAGLESESLENDARTVLNSILGAYGLPKMSATKGFKAYDDVEEGVYFEYPTAWVKRRNTLRPGVYISNFDTADKIALEVFPVPDSLSPEILSDGGSARHLYETDRFSEEVMAALLFPGSEVGGDSRLELPPISKVKKEISNSDGSGREMCYLYFPSETITRSGYQIRRKNLVVTAERKGLLYVLGASARNDQWNPAKKKLLQTVILSFRLYN